LNAMANAPLTLSALQPCRDIDRLALLEGHDRFLEIALLAFDALEPLDLPFADQRIDSKNLDVEQAFNGLFDLWFRRIDRDFEHDLAVLRRHGRLLSHER